MSLREHIKERLAAFYEKHKRPDKVRDLSHIVDEIRFHPVCRIHRKLKEKYHDSIWNDSEVEDHVLLVGCVPRDIPRPYEGFIGMEDYTPLQAKFYGNTIIQQPRRRST
jgi:hypothetical protein